MPTYWEIILKTMIGNVVIYKVDAPMYVILSEAEKQLHYGKAVGITKCMTFYLRFRTNHRRCNQV